MTVLQASTKDVREELRLARQLLRLTITENPYIPIEPTEAQAAFLAPPVSEVLYGGAGGGGKTIGLLAAALQFVCVPRYSGILFRRTFTDLEQSGGLIPLAHEWLSDTDAEWDGQQHLWTFPRYRSSLAFGYMESDNDRFRYKGPPFQFVGFDELTSFSEVQYRFMFSRRRRLKGQNIPLRTRSATNPGDRGHEWVKRRFIDGNNPGRLYIPATMQENPYLDVDAYRESLIELDPVTRAQMEHGDWEIRPEGNLFKRSWLDNCYVPRAPALKQVVRYWDLAATKPEPGKDPDHASGAKCGVGEDGLFYICHMNRLRDTPQAVESAWRSQTQRDTTAVGSRIEQEPGSASKMLIDNLARSLPAYDVRGIRSVNDKVTRSRPFSAACERGDVRIVSGEWVDAFLDELCAFPEVSHDDQVDAVAGAYAELMGEYEPWNPAKVKSVFDYQYDT